MKLQRETIRNRIINSGGDMIRALEGFIARSSLVGNPAYFEPAVFPWTAEIEADWRTIRDELDEVLKRPEDLPPFQEISKDQRHLTMDDKWRTYFLYAFGFKAKQNCERCPETARLVESIPGMTTAFFSVLEPGKHLPDHRGAYKGVLRYHLGLLIPEPAISCRIRVGTEIRCWHEGESLIFDDTYRHEVWNDADSRRVVLFVDFVRPLRFPANVVNQAVIQAIKHSPFVTDAVANYESWQKRLDLAT